MTENFPKNHLVAIALLQQPRFGAAALRAVLRAAHESGMPLDAWIESPPEALARRLDASITAMVVAARPLDLSRAERLAKTLAAIGGRSLLLTDDPFPQCLLDLPDPPPLVFLLGNDELLNEAAGAVVGARIAPPEGLRLAAESAAILAAEGPVVSGGAVGVDLAAHESAIQAAGGRSIIVLPQGIATYDAPEFLARAQEEHRLLAISAELPLDAWETHRAVGRNAIIAALARVVVVIEPGKTGGSIRTAEVALAIGRRVFVWGSEIRRETLDRLIASGAQPLLDDDGLVRADALREAMRQPLVPPEDDMLLF